MNNLKTLLSDVFQNSPQQFLKVWARAWPYILVFAIIDESFTYMAVALVHSLNPDPIYSSAIKFLFGLFFSILALLVYQPLIHFTYNQQDFRLLEHFKKHISPLAIESLRALGRISIASVALLIPGLVLWVRYYFVVNIVQFYGPYDRGEVDALKRSWQMSVGKFWSVSFLVILTNLPYVLTLVFEFDPYVFYGIKPTLLLSLVGELYAQLLFYNLYTVLIHKEGEYNET